MTAKYKHPVQSALARALDCPPEHPLHKAAARLIGRALASGRKRWAAQILGIHEVRLSELLRAHPELDPNRPADKST